MKNTVRRRSHSGVFANITLGLLPAFVVLALASTVQGREAPDIGGASRPCGAEASVGCGYPQQPPERTLREQVEYWERGKASLEQGRYEEAAEAFTAAIEIGPKAGVLFIAREDGRAVVIVTHDPRIEDIADRVLWLEDGKLRDRKSEQHEWTRDPVCRMQVDRWTAELTAEHDGVTYAFCSGVCLEKFETNPSEYLGRA